MLTIRRCRDAAGGRCGPRACQLLSQAPATVPRSAQPTSATTVFLGIFVKPDLSAITHRQQHRIINSSLILIETVGTVVVDRRGHMFRRGLAILAQHVESFTSARELRLQLPDHLRPGALRTATIQRGESEAFVSRVLSPAACARSGRGGRGQQVEALGPSTERVVHSCLSVGRGELLTPVGWRWRLSCGRRATSSACDTPYMDTGRF